jgi:hypothetical protein
VKLRSMALAEDMKLLIFLHAVEKKEPNYIYKCSVHDKKLTVNCKPLCRERRRYW